MIEITKKFIEGTDLSKQKKLLNKYYNLKGKYMLFVHKEVFGSKYSIKLISDVCIDDGKTIFKFGRISPKLTKHILSHGNLGMVRNLKIERLNFDMFSKFLVFDNLIKLNQYLDSEQTLLNL